MAARRADVVLLTDANALVSGIVTDKDIATRVIVEEIPPDQTVISKVMTMNPIFVTSHPRFFIHVFLSVGKFRHLPIVENGEVIAMLDITKCLYDATLRMEKAAKHGSAIVAAIEGVERQFSSNFTAPSAFIEALRERMFKPSLSTIIAESSMVATVSPSNPVQVAAKKTCELRVNSALITTGSKIHSKDILLRVVAANLSPELTLVEKVMTPNPECATLETTILEALHIMQDAKFLHLPVVDKDGCPVACLDVLQLTHAAITMVDNSSGTVNDVANTVMQKFRDSALNLEPPDDFDTQSEMSMSQYMASEAAEHAKSSYPSLGLGTSFSFKFEDCKTKGRALKSLYELVCAVVQHVGDVDHEIRPQLLYEDDEGNKVILSTDGDLTSAVTNARSAGQKVLTLHLYYPPPNQETVNPSPETSTARKTGLIGLKTGVFAGAVTLTCIGVLIYLKRARA